MVHFRAIRQTMVVVFVFGTLNWCGGTGGDPLGLPLLISEDLLCNFMFSGSVSLTCLGIDWYSINLLHQNIAMHAKYRKTCSNSHLFHVFYI